MSLDGFAARYPHLRHKCRVCRNLLEPEAIRLMASEPAPSLFSAQQRPKLVTVARLEDPHKAISRSLLVARMLRDAGYDFEWVFIGGSTPYNEALYRDFVCTSGLADCVRLPGGTSNPFPAVLKADLFCLFSHYEGLPNTIYESLIIGTPVMATNVGAVAEQIDPACGWLVDSDTGAIFQGLAQLLAAPQKLAQARQRLQGYEYDVSAIQRQVEAILTPAERETDGGEPVVSVIVPVYNVQDYLDECLASLERQTLKYIEVIMVNDGSTDGSGEIMDAYTKRYPGKFFRYDKENGGLSDARNFGLARARGSYVSFIDSDDFVDADMLERMLAAAEEHRCDIVLCDMIVFEDNSDYQAVAVPDRTFHARRLHRDAGAVRKVGFLGHFHGRIYATSLQIVHHRERHFSYKFAHVRGRFGGVAGAEVFHHFGADLEVRRTH